MLTATALASAARTHYDPEGPQACHALAIPTTSAPHFLLSMEQPTTPFLPATLPRVKEQLTSCFAL